MNYACVPKLDLMMEYDEFKTKQDTLRRQLMHYDHAETPQYGVETEKRRAVQHRLNDIQENLDAIKEALKAIEQTKQNARDKLARGWR
ncbi:MAG: hypothetical protein GY861_02675 [bacterium]|nr:hypothetical protein [bacterium]